MVLLFIGGKDEWVEELGDVADSCPVCMDVTRHTIVSQHLGPMSIWFVPMGKEKLVGYAITCHRCDSSRVADLDDYNEVVTDIMNFATLINTTSPGIKERYADFLEIEDRAITEPESITQEERRILIKEHFTIQSDVIKERELNTSQFDFLSGAGCLLTMTLPILVFWIASVMKLDAFKEQVNTVVRTIVFVGFPLTIYAMWGVEHRYLQNTVKNELAKALYPLNPSKEDLEECLIEFRNRKLSFAKIKIDALLKEIRKLNAMPDRSRKRSKYR